jgi:hypothetical protein
VRTRRAPLRLVAALQAAVTAFAVLIASHHQADVAHVETAAGAFIHAAGDAVTAGERTITDRTAAAPDGTPCLLCQIAHAPQVLVTPPALVVAAPYVARHPAPSPAVAPSCTAIWRTAPKTSPPA